MEIIEQFRSKERRESHDTMLYNAVQAVFGVVCVFVCLSDMCS